MERLSITAESDSLVAATFFSGAVKHVIRYVFTSESGASRAHRAAAPQIIAEMLASREVDPLAGGVARKWRRKSLIRLNPRPELVGARKYRTHKIRRPGARLTVCDLGSRTARCR
jgi:hypothetical protein